MKVYPVVTPSKPQYPPPRPLLCGRYPPSVNFVLILSRCGTRSGCDPSGSSDPLSRQLELITHLKSTVAWVQR